MPRDMRSLVAFARACLPFAMEICSTRSGPMSTSWVWSTEARKALKDRASEEERSDMIVRGPALFHRPSRLVINATLGGGGGGAVGRVLGDKFIFKV